MLCSNIIMLSFIIMLSVIMSTAQAKSKKKYVIFVPYKDQTIHHTHTIYVHLYDKDDVGKIEENHKNSYHHEWNTFSYSGYNKGSSGHHNGDGEFFHKGGSPGTNNGNYKSNYINNYGRQPSDNFHADYERIKYDLGENDNSNYGQNSGGDEHKSNSFGEQNSGGDGGKYIHEQGKDDHGTWSYKSYKYDSGKDGEKDHGNEGDKYGHNHNHGGGKHEWQSYSDLIDHHGHRDEEHHEKVNGESTEDGWKGMHVNNLKTGENMGNDEGHGTHYNHKNKHGNEYEHHDHGDKVALKQSHYDTGYKKWKNYYY